MTQGEPKLVNYQLNISSDTSLSLPETISLPSTPSTISQIPTTPLPLNVGSNLDDRYRQLLSNSIPLTIDWTTFVAPLSYLVNILTATDYINGHSTDYNTNGMFTKTYKNIIYKF